MLFRSVTGILTEVDTAVAGVEPKSLAVGPSGRFAYVTNNTSNNVTTFSIDSVTGALTEVGTAVIAGSAPRSIAVDPAGRFAYVANFDSNDVTTFSIDSVTGALTKVGASVMAGTGSHSITLVGGSL